MADYKKINRLKRDCSPDPPYRWTPASVANGIPKGYCEELVIMDQPAVVPAVVPAVAPVVVPAVAPVFPKLDKKCDRSITKEELIKHIDDHFDLLSPNDKIKFGITTRASLKRMIKQTLCDIAIQSQENVLVPKQINVIAQPVVQPVPDLEQAFREMHIDEFALEQLPNMEQKKKDCIINYNPDLCKDFDFNLSHDLQERRIQLLGFTLFSRCAKGEGIEEQDIIHRTNLINQKFGTNFDISEITKFCELKNLPSGNFLKILESNEENLKKLDILLTKNPFDQKIIMEHVGDLAKKPLTIHQNEVAEPREIIIPHDYEFKDSLTFFPNDSQNVKYRYSDVSLYSSANIQQAKETFTVIKQYYRDTSKITITDGCACIGANTWIFSEMCKAVNAVELMPLHFSMLVHNLEQSCIKNTTFYNADYLNVQNELTQDVLFFDPPWSGINYKEVKDILIGFLDRSSNPKGEFKDISQIIEEYKLYNKSQLILLRVPNKYKIPGTDTKYNEYNWKLSDNTILKCSNYDIRDENNFPIYKIIAICTNFHYNNTFRNFRQIRLNNVPRVNYKPIYSNVTTVKTGLILETGHVYFLKNYESIVNLDPSFQKKEWGIKHISGNKIALDSIDEQSIDLYFVLAGKVSGDKVLTGKVQGVQQRQVAKLIERSPQSFSIVDSGYDISDIYAIYNELPKSKRDIEELERMISDREFPYIYKRMIAPQYYFNNLSNVNIGERLIIDQNVDYQNINTNYKLAGINFQSFWGKNKVEGAVRDLGIESVFSYSHPKLQGGTDEIEYRAAVVINPAQDDYIERDIITNLFSERQRMIANVKDKLSPIEYWNRHKVDVAKKVNDKGLELTDENLSQELFNMYKDKKNSPVGEATLFKVSLAKTIYELYKSAGTGKQRILDISSGWGDRLIGAINSGCTRYLGFDPNESLQEAYNKIIKTFGGNHPERFEVRVSGFEQAQIDEKFDMVLTSPPYFDFEIYSQDKGQSVINYNTYESWIWGFYLPSLSKAYNALEENGIFAIYIRDIKEMQNIVERTILYLIGYKGANFHGMIGASSGLNNANRQPVWIFRKPYHPSDNKSYKDAFDYWYNKTQELPKVVNNKFTQDELVQLFKRWNPPIVPKAMKLGNINYNLIDDGDLIGGSKIRVLIRLMANIKEGEVLYAGPDSGLGFVAVSVAAKVFGKKATVFLNTYKYANPKPVLVDFIERNLGTNIRIDYSNNRYGRKLQDTLSHAQKYHERNKDTTYLFPFGLDDPNTVQLFTQVLGEALQGIKHPKRLWLVGGSGTLLKVLQSIWPETTFMVTQVGRTIFPDQLRYGKDQLFVAPEKFWENAKIVPPWETLTWYDGKLYQFFQEYVEEDDYVWNVGSLPTVEKLRAMGL